MKTVSVRTEKPYEVLIEHGILDRAGQIVAQQRAMELLDLEKPAGELIAPGKCCIVTDRNVEAFYLEETRVAFRAGGFDVCNFVIDGGEASKTMQVASSLIDFLAEMRFTRSDLIVALGGGVVGDLAGFAAAMYMRGIDYVQIPTTVLAAVDSSVGGKTAVNLLEGKNLAGAFHQPIQVIIDPGLFDTLPSDIYNQGLAEAIKAGMIADRFLFESFELGSFDIEDTIAKAIAIKARIVSADEEDRSVRNLLNLGHTVAHAIEKASAYEISHGDAVAIGLYTVTNATGAKKLTERVYRTLTINGLPWKCDIPKEEILAQIALDKKRQGNTIKIVVPIRIGECEIREMALDEAKEFLSKGFE